jgi:hypothetical protein
MRCDLRVILTVLILGLRCCSGRNRVTTILRGGQRYSWCGMIIVDRGFRCCYYEPSATQCNERVRLTQGLFLRNLSNSFVEVLLHLLII